jgi:Arc/MetJ-type ribon-helix-helix transcriptional regulator
MSQLEIQMPETTELYIQEQVASGKFSNPSEYVVDLVERDRQRARKEFEDMLLAGLHSGGGEEVTPGYWEGLKEEWGKKYRPEASP